MLHIGMKRKSQKGEVATAITIGALLLLGAVSLVSSYILNKGRLKTKPRAASTSAIYAQEYTGQDKSLKERPYVYFFVRKEGKEIVCFQQNRPRFNVDDGPKLQEGSSWNAWEICEGCREGDWNFVFGAGKTKPSLPVQYRGSKWLYRISSYDSFCRIELNKIEGVGNSTSRATSPAGSSAPSSGTVAKGTTNKTWVENSCYRINAKFRPIMWEGSKTGFLSWVEVETKDGRGGNAQLLANGRHVAGVNSLSGGKLIWGPELTQYWLPGQSIPIAAISSGSTQVTYEVDLDSCGSQRRLAVSCTLNFTSLGKGTVSGQGCWCEGENCEIFPIPTPRPEAGSGGAGGGSRGGGIGGTTGDGEPASTLAEGQTQQPLSQETIISCKDLDKFINKGKIGLISATFFGISSEQKPLQRELNLSKQTLELKFNFDVETLASANNLFSRCFTNDRPIISFPGIIDNPKIKRVRKDTIVINIDKQDFNALKNNLEGITLSLNYCLNSVIDIENKSSICKEGKEFIIPVDEKGEFGGNKLYNVLSFVLTTAVWSGGEDKPTTCAYFPLDDLSVVESNYSINNNKLSLTLKFNKNLESLNKMNCIIDSPIIIGSDIKVVPYRIDGYTVRLDNLVNYYEALKQVSSGSYKIYFAICQNPVSYIGAATGITCNGKLKKKNITNNNIQSTIGGLLSKIVPVAECAKINRVEADYDIKRKKIIKVQLDDTTKPYSEACFKNFKLEGDVILYPSPMPPSGGVIKLKEGFSSVDPNTGWAIIELGDYDVQPNRTYSFLYEHCSKVDLSKNQCIGKFTKKTWNIRWSFSRASRGEEKREQFISNPTYVFTPKCFAKLNNQTYSVNWKNLKLFGVRKNEIKLIKESVDCGQPVQITLEDLSGKWKDIPSLPSQFPAGQGIEISLELKDNKAKEEPGFGDYITDQVILSFPGPGTLAELNNFCKNNDCRIDSKSNNNNVEYGKKEFTFTKFSNDVRERFDKKLVLSTVLGYQDKDGKIQNSNIFVKDKFVVKVNSISLYESEIPEKKAEIPIFLLLGPGLADNSDIIASANGYLNEYYIGNTLKLSVSKLTRGKEHEFVLRRICKIQGNNSESYVDCSNEGKTSELGDNFIYAKCIDKNYKELTPNNYPPVCDVAQCRYKDLTVLYKETEGFLSPKVEVESGGKKCSLITGDKGVNFVLLNYTSENVILTELELRKDVRGGDPLIRLSKNMTVNSGNYLYLNYKDIKNDDNFNCSGRYYINRLKIEKGGKTYDLVSKYKLNENSDRVRSSCKSGGKIFFIIEVTDDVLQGSEQPPTPAHHYPGAGPQK